MYVHIMLQKKNIQIKLYLLYFLNSSHNEFLSTASVFFASYNQGCDSKNRLTIGKFSMIDTSNKSKEVDAKNLHLYSIYNEFSNIGPTCRTWSWGIKVKKIWVT